MSGLCLLLLLPQISFFIHLVYSRELLGQPNNLLGDNLTADNFEVADVDKLLKMVFKLP